MVVASIAGSHATVMAALQFHAISLLALSWCLGITYHDPRLRRSPLWTSALADRVTAAERRVQRRNDFSRRDSCPNPTATATADQDGASQEHALLGWRHHLRLLISVCADSQARFRDANTGSEQASDESSRRLGP